MSLEKTYEHEKGAGGHSAPWSFINQKESGWFIELMVLGFLRLVKTPVATAVGETSVGEMSGVAVAAAVPSQKIPS